MGNTWDQHSQTQEASIRIRIRAQMGPTRCFRGRTLNLEISLRTVLDFVHPDSESKGCLTVPLDWTGLIGFGI